MKKSVEKALLGALMMMAMWACSSDDGARARDGSAHGVESAKAFPTYVSTDDLDSISERHLLRVLVYGVGETHLARAGSPAHKDRVLAEAVGKTLGVDVQFILVENYGDLIPMLQGGQGDLVAAQMTVTPERAKQVAFTRPTRSVDEVLVSQRGAKDSPKTLSDLAGRDVHVRQSSSYAQTVDGLVSAEGEPLAVRLVAADESIPTETLVYQVSRGERPLTVADSNILDMMDEYNEDFERALTLATGREIAWAVRPGNPKLRAAIDGALSQELMTGHTKAVFEGDLAGMKKRGAIRILTRNNANSYFLYRGKQMGFDYELMKLFAKKLGLRMELVVPPSHEDLIPWLLEGRGDVIAASMTITPERSEKVTFSSRYLEVEEVLVQHSDAALIGAIDALGGQTVTVRKGTSYVDTLKALQATGVALVIEEVPLTVETEALLARVARGEIAWTLADSHMVTMMETQREPVRAVRLSDLGSNVSQRSQLGFAVRPSAPELTKALDGFVSETYRGLEYNMLRKRYFENRRQVTTAKEKRATKTGELSPYDAIIKTYATKYGFDWRLMAAQAFVESEFNPKAKSWAGARGLFQVMPRTAKELGFSDLENPDQGIHAGIKYMNHLMGRFNKSLPFRQRLRFALAAYNVGLGHVRDARRLAREQGFNPDRWFGNVEKAMLMLQHPTHCKRARFGYCRGSEPVQYVSKIQSLYDAYTELVKP